ncbi:hypothetical protein [Clostridium taeniosporum]|uniref:Uncharacterized protein n=1 Tax=Clostridium taeniosporum TaxID=394958 RepID=A0A1D7XIG0_9CLOT|nr:hypothetical protein [Clostridium taeniosporum]AOR23112.1 hypothetical protein BGI42_04965 [Clostridium taeniosporum]
MLCVFKLFKIRKSTSPQILLAELCSVIYGLEHVRESIYGNEEVRSDLQQIVEFINDRIYDEWDKVAWRKGRKPIRRILNTGISLCFLLNFFL